MDAKNTVCWAVLCLAACVPCRIAAADRNGPSSREEILLVHDDAGLRAAVAGARPGTHIRIAPGRYHPNVWATNFQGSREQPIVIEGADPQNPPVFDGGGDSWHLVRPTYVTLRNLAAQHQTDNGLNIDDGGTYDRTPAHHITLEKIHVADVGPKGNYDGIKLSGVDDFVLRDCTVEGWGGQAVDMVGCHRGLIEGCTFRGKPGFTQDDGPQTKGGSSQITIRRSLFVQAGPRPVQLGGSTSLSVFRPRGALYEARDITVEGCTFLGGETAVAFTGVVGGVVRYNTILYPEKWVMRILQENTAPGFAPCRDGRFEHNLVVFRRGGLQEIVNIGPNTRPETFQFRDNLWYCEDRPAASRPELPAAEAGGVYDRDPKLERTQGERASLFPLRPTNPRAAAFGAGALPAAPAGAHGDRGSRGPAGSGDVLGCEHFAFLRASISGGLGGPAREALRSWGSEKAGGMDRQGTYYHIDGNNSIIQRVKDGVVRLFAGDGTRGYRDGPADQAQFDFGCGSYLDADVQCDAEGSVYVSEAQAGRLRKIARQPDGAWIVSTVAGGGQRQLKKGEAIPARDIKLGVASRFALTPEGTVYTVGWPGILRIQDGRGTLLADPTELKKALGERTALADWHVGGSHITPDGMFYWMPGGGPNLLRFDTRTGKAERFAGIGRTEQYLDGPTLLTSGFHTVLVVYSPDASLIYTCGGDESVPRRIYNGRVMSLYRDGVFRPFDRNAQPPGGRGREDRWNQMAGVQCLDPRGRLYLTTGDYGWGGWVVRMTFAGGQQP
jgi:hypothetical protein